MNANKNSMVKVELLDRSNEQGIAKAVTAVWRSAETAQKWADGKNQELDFYGPRCWVVCK